MLFQLGNEGEVAKYLQTLPSHVLQSSEVRFVVAVWGALRTANYSKFFKLLKKASLLQACLMHRYVGEVRLAAMRKILRAFCPAKTSTLLLADLSTLFLFDSDEDCSPEELQQFFAHAVLEERVPRRRRPPARCRLRVCRFPRCPFQFW